MNNILLKNYYYYYKNYKIDIIEKLLYSNYKYSNNFVNEFDELLIDIEHMYDCAFINAKAKKFNSLIGNILLHNKIESNSIIRLLDIYYSFSKSPYLISELCFEFTVNILILLGYCNYGYNNIIELLSNICCRCPSLLYKIIYILKDSDNIKPNIREILQPNLPVGRYKCDDNIMDVKSKFEIRNAIYTKINDDSEIICYADNYFYTYKVYILYVLGY